MSAVADEWQGIWCKKWDDTYKRFYWANSETLASTWDAPPEWKENAAVAGPPPVAQEKKEADPNNDLWVTMYDEAKYQYFINIRTHDTRWTKPTIGRFSVWHGMLDPSSQKKYYVHSESHATQWDVPAEIATELTAVGKMTAQDFAALKTPERPRSRSPSPPPPPPDSGEPADWQAKVQNMEKKEMMKRERQKSIIMHSTGSGVAVRSMGSFDEEEEDSHDDDAVNDHMAESKSNETSKIYDKLFNFAPELDGMLAYASKYYPVQVRGYFTNIQANLRDIIKYLASDMDELGIGGRDNTGALVEWERMDWNFNQPEVANYHGKVRSLDYSKDVFEDWHCPQLFNRCTKLPKGLDAISKVTCLFPPGAHSFSHDEFTTMEVPVTMRAIDALNMCLPKSGFNGNVADFCFKAQGYNEFMFGQTKLIDYAFIKNLVMQNKPRYIVMMKVPPKIPPCLPPAPVPWTGDQRPENSVLWQESESRWGIQIKSLAGMLEPSAFPILQDSSFNHVMVSSFLFHGLQVVPGSKYELHPNKLRSHVEFKDKPLITDIRLRDLPRETRHAMLVYGIKGTSKSLLGWVVHNLIDEKGVYSTGLKTLNIWGSTVEMQKQHELNAEKRAEALQNQANLEQMERTVKKDKKYAKKMEAERLKMIADFLETDYDYIFRGPNRPNHNSACTAASISFHIHLDSEAHDTKIYAPKYIERPEPSKAAKGPVMNQKGLKMSGLIVGFNTLVNMDPLYKLTQNDRDLLWQARELLIKKPPMLHRFLECVDWFNPARVWEGYRILEKFTPPQDPANLLTLLDAKFQDVKIREYAVAQFDKLKDDELQLYLLQLVQQLKSENYHHSALSDFLIRRGMKSPFVIGHYLFWHLKAETVNPAFCERYAVIMEQLLLVCDYTAKELRKQNNVIGKLQRAAERVRTRKDSGKFKKAANKKIFAQEIKELNENFLGRMPGGKFQVPLFPTLEITTLIVGKCSFMSSKMVPLWLCCNNADQTAPPGETASVVQIMFKSGDDLRQDILTLQVLELMDKLWLNQGLDLRMTFYKVIATGVNSQNAGVGMLAPVTEAETTSGIQISYGGGASGAWTETVIADYIKEFNRTPAQYEIAVENFMRSCAGYCVATSILGIGDRHNGNIMVKRQGNLFHIDFGHFLGNFKSKFGVKRERVAFVFTPDMAHVIGGGSKRANSKRYQQFLGLCEEAFSILRQPNNVQQIFSMFQSMVTAGMPELTAEEDILYMKERMVLDKSDKDARAWFRKEINDSKVSKWRQLDNWFHNKKHG